MPLYHNSPDGPRRCKAVKGRCPYALAGQPHFNNVGDARTAYEGDLQKKFGSIYAHATLSKTDLKQKAIESYYRKLDLGDISPSQDRAIRTLRALARGGVRASSYTVQAVGRTGLRAARMSGRLATGLASGHIRGSRGGRGHNLKLNKLLLTKYWVPDRRSNKWKTSRFA